MSLLGQKGVGSMKHSKGEGTPHGTTNSRIGSEAVRVGGPIGIARLSD